MREDLTFEDFARDYYGESRHEYSDTVEIKQEKKLFGYKDCYPDREKKIQRLCYKPITFCRTYKVPFQEEIKSEFKIRKWKYHNYRDETITKTVSFTIEGRKAEEILAKMCQDSQNGLLSEYKKDSNGWYEKMIRSDAPRLIVDRLYDIYAPQCLGILQSEDYINHPDWRFHSIFSVIFNCDLNGVIYLTNGGFQFFEYSEIGYQNLDNKEQASGLSAVVLESLLTKFKQESYCRDIFVNRVNQGYKVPGAELKLVFQKEKEEIKARNLKAW